MCGMWELSCCLPRSSGRRDFSKEVARSKSTAGRRGNHPDIKELLVFYAKGITAILPVSEKLSDDWKEQISETNSILRKMDMAPFTIQDEKLELEKNDSCSRRELFSLWGKEGKSLVKQVTPAKWRFNHSNLELSRYYPDYQFYTVVVDTKKCSLCRACEALCPKQCFSISDDAFLISPQACSDCQLCSDACPENAITVKEHVSKALEKSYETYLNNCEVCGTSFRTLSKQDNKCPVCSKRKAGYLLSKA